MIGLIVCLAASTLVLAGMPEPSCIIYGQARDEYGWPYVANAEVFMVVGDRVVSRCEVAGTLAPGVNFALKVWLQNSYSNAPYVANAVSPGDRFIIKVHANGADRTVMEAPAFPPLPSSGATLNLNATAGEDVDGDGLPDAWESELLGLSGGRYTTVAQILAGDDLDGDGMSNGDEYTAGTLAYWDRDYFFIEELSAASGNRLELAFLSVLGKSYSLQQTTNLVTGVWQDVAFAQSPQGPQETSICGGTGYMISLFVPATNQVTACRLRVQ